MPRASLQVGQFVQLGAAGGALSRYHGLRRDQVLRIDAIVPRAVYHRKAFSVSCGGESFIVWPSQVRKVRHPARRRKR